MFYWIFRMMAAVTLRLFFRNIEVVGEPPPASGPVLLVSNHANSLVDPLLSLITLKRRVTLTAKNVLKKDPFLALLTWGLGSIPFHRKEDQGKGSDPRQNVESMRRCRQTLELGGALYIFPEGISHSDLQLRPFHIGAARIAADYVRKDHNPGNLRIVPIGLLYTGKSRFRSEVCVCYGPPLDMAQWAAAHPKLGVDELTAELRRRIENLIITYQHRREMVVLNCARDIVTTQAWFPAVLGSKAPPTSEFFQTLRNLQDGYRRLESLHPDKVAALGERVRDYRRQLKHDGIEPADVYLPLNIFRAVLFLLRELELVFIGAPLAIWGAINHLLPVLAVRQIARKLSTDTDHWATNVIYPSFVVFPVFYLIQLAAAWVLLSPPWAALYTLALPYTGIYLILYRERAGSAWKRARTFVFFLFHSATQRRLADEGRAILASVQELAAMLPQT
jgi:glycerol-3-phosphate O-acyltransferase/dihydroxyacetone phosphate acyltransferase